MHKVYFEPSLPDRVISALSYLSAGWIGLIYMVVLYFARKGSSKFLRFNVYQSIILCCLRCYLQFVIGMIYTLFFDLLTHIPFIQIIVSWIDLFLSKPTFGNYSILQALVVVYLAYVVIWSLLGKFPMIFKISRLFYRI